MADVVTTLSKLNGITKTKFAEKIKDRIPEAVKFFSRLSMLKNGKLGRKYEQPIELVLPQGMTYAAPLAGAFDIEDMEAGVMEVAEVDANQFLFADSLDYESEAKAASSGDAAYEAAVGRVVKRAMKAFTKRVELSFLYGHTSLAKIQSMASSTDNGDGTYDRVLTIYQKSWASGIWLGMKNAKLEFRTLDSNGYATSTRHGSGVIKVKRINVVNHTITVVGAQSDVNAILADDGIVFAGTYGKETVGLDRIATNTGELHEIDAADYNEQWAANVVSNGDRQLTLRRIYEAMAPAIGKGLEDMDVQCFLNPATFGDLIATEASLRRYAEATGQATNGFKTLKFQGQHGMIEFIPYINIKEGEAFIGPMETMAKLGAQDITMVAPGRKDGEYWKPMERKAGYEMRLYANLGLFCDIPGWWTKITNIVNA
jgi:hypothetical protein